MSALPPPFACYAPALIVVATVACLVARHINMYLDGETPPALHFVFMTQHSRLLPPILIYLVYYLSLGWNLGLSIEIFVIFVSLSFFSFIGGFIFREFGLYICVNASLSIAYFYISFHGFNLFFFYYRSYLYINYT